MILHTFEHRGRRWDAVVHPVTDLTEDCGLEFIFAARGAPEVKYAWPIKRATLDRITGTHLNLTNAELRELLDQAIRLNRRPPATSASAGAPGTTR